VRLAITGPAPGLLPGMSGQAVIATDTHENAVVVPIQAVTVRTARDLEGRKDGPPKPVADAVAAPAKRPGQVERREPLKKVVFVVDGAVARARLVEVGLASESEIEIASGLKPGEVVVEGPYKALSRELQDGKPVKKAEPAQGARRP
jgi:HlyD family secretion protein